MIVHSRFTTLFASLGLAFSLAACSPQSDKDKLMEAQFCLDEADQGEAAACVSPIANLQSSTSYVLQCSAKLIDSGITTPSNLAQALSSISDSGSNSTTELLTLLNMGDTTIANQTADLCTKSGQPGFALLGALAKSATVLASASNLFGSCNDISSCDLSNMQDTIDELKKALDGNAGTVSTISLSDAQDQVEVIAGAVQSVYTVTCGAANTNADLCGPINQALSDAGITNVTSLTQAELINLGTKLLNQWQP